MILPNSHLLKHRILYLFRQKPALTAEKIQNLLAKSDKSCSLQAVYKELRGLMEEGIVQKIGTTYALHATWVLQLQAFAARLATVTFSDKDGFAQLMHQKKRQSWKFDSLLAMNDLWAHLFVYLARHAKNKDLLAWNPHLWFHLFQREREDRFLKSILAMGCRFHVMVGGTHFLDQWAKELFDKNGVVYSQTRGPFYGDTKNYFNVIDDHILTLKLTDATDRRLAQVYGATQNAEQFFASDLINVFMRDGHCTLSLEYNPKKAERLRCLFSNYFGAEL